MKRLVRTKKKNKKEKRKKRKKKEKKKEIPFVETGRAYLFLNETVSMGLKQEIIVYVPFIYEKISDLSFLFSSF